MQHYNKDEVDALIKEAMTVIEELTEANLSLSDNNKDLQKKLSEKSANQDKVVLEKVASPIYPAEDVQEFIDMLVNVHMLDEKDSVKVASTLEKDPGQLLKLAQRVVTLSITPSTGRGVTKTAYDRAESSQTSDPDGWWDAVRPVKR